MKTLIFVRMPRARKNPFKGDNGEEYLTTAGRKRLFLLAPKVKEMIGEKGFVVFSPYAGEGLETFEIILSEMNVPEDKVIKRLPLNGNDPRLLPLDFLDIEDMFVSDGCGFDEKAEIEIFNSREEDVVIVVTTEECIRECVCCLNKKSKLQMGPLKQGEMGDVCVVIGGESFYIYAD